EPVAGGHRAREDVAPVADAAVEGELPEPLDLQLEPDDGEGRGALDGDGEGRLTRLDGARAGEGAAAVAEVERPRVAAPEPHVVAGEVGVGGGLLGVAAREGHGGEE